MPVDVFHFDCKHKEKDKFCSENCNPALFPELVVGDKWLFNSSAAEQANAWIGGFQAMVREMRVERYNFFLDEVIRRRNSWLIREQKKRGRNPRAIPLINLLPKTLGAQ